MALPLGDVGEPAGGVEAGGLAVGDSAGGVVGEAAGGVCVGPSPVRSAGASVQATVISESRASEPTPKRALVIGNLRRGAAAWADAPGLNGF